MPLWNFSKPAKVSRRKNKIPKSIAVMEKNIKAVVNLNDSLLYSAIFEDGRNILIHKSCYKCKGKQTIYSQCLVGKYKQRLMIHRIPDYCIEHRPYLPFAVGCVIEGDIILNQETIVFYFKIKKCYIDPDNWFADRITKEFRDRYNKELEDKIIQHYTEFDYESI